MKIDEQLLEKAYDQEKRLTERKQKKYGLDASGFNNYSPSRYTITKNILIRYLKMYDKEVL